MESLPPLVRILLALGLGLFLGWKVVRSLQRGEVTYRRSLHKRSEEPKTFWLSVIWFGFLATSSLVYAVMETILMQRTTP